MFCSEAWDLFNESKKIKQEDVQKILSSLLKKENHAFQEIWDNLNPLQRRIISAVAHEAQVEVFSGYFIQKYNFQTVAAIQRSVGTLIRKDLLYKGEGKYRIADPLFNLWLI